MTSSRLSREYVRPLSWILPSESFQTKFGTFDRSPPLWRASIIMTVGTSVVSPLMTRSISGRWMSSS